MEKRLRENEHKNHWKNECMFDLENGVLKNWKEIRECALGRMSPFKCLENCIDIANYAMMIADNWGGLMEGGGK